MTALPPPPRSIPRPGWRRHTTAAALALASALAVTSGCATLDEKQREWIFQPSDRTWSGGLAAAQGMADVWIPVRAGDASGPPLRLHGLWLGQARPDAPVLLYLHGARWDVRGSAHRMRRMHELGFAVLGIDYRGFGQSSPGLPSEDSAHEDARTAWAWLGAQHPGAPRYLFGHSLGAAIAVRLAAEAPGVAGLMVEGSFPSIPELLSQFKWGWLPVSPLITQRFDAAARIAQVRAPVLVVHGSHDSLIPPALGRMLFERAAEPKRWELVEGGSHHSTHGVGQAQYREAVAALFGVGAAGGSGQAGMASR